MPYHRILIITYRGRVVFENRKIAGLAEIIAGNSVRFKELQEGEEPQVL